MSSLGRRCGRAFTLFRYCRLRKTGIWCGDIWQRRQEKGSCWVLRRRCTTTIGMSDESGSIHISGAGLIIIGSCGLRTRSHRATPQSKSTLYANRKACTYWGVQGVRVVGTPTKDKSFNKIQRLSPFDRNTVEFAPVSTRSFTLALSQPLGYPLCRDQDHQELHPPKACLAASQFPPGGSNLD